MKAKQKVRQETNRTCIVRLMVTPEEKRMLEQLAYERTGGNVSEYVRRKLFAQNGGQNGQRENRPAESA